jgi:DNA-binding response OmpR family regulator
MRILMVEGSTPLVSFLCKGLAAEHFAVDLMPDTFAGERALAESQYDLVILDLNPMAGESRQVIQRFRERQPGLPILVLAARPQQAAATTFAGATWDYLVKPFSFTELSARVRAVLRRMLCHPAKPLRVGDLVLDGRHHRVTRAGRSIELTPKEFSLLEFLMRHAGEPVSRAMIIGQVWNLSSDTMTNVVDVYVNYLRKKVDDSFQPKLIRTVRGVGYLIAGEALHAG